MPIKRLLLLCLLLVVSSSVFAGHLVRFNGNIPSGFDAAVAAAGGTITSRHDGAGFAAVSGLTADTAAALAGSNGVAEVLEDAGYQVRLGTPTVSDESVPEIASPAVPSLAFFYPRQWHLRQIGAHIAWAAGRRGSAGVTVAVLDTGISYTHADLAGRVDLSRSVSFVPSDDALVNTYFPGFHPVTDLHYHGTHVAATISSNALAAAGVTSQVTLIGVKVLGVTGNGSFEGIVNGILWAADKGADVANMSLGADFPRAHNGRFTAFLQNAVNYAHRKGTLVVVAAGNDAIDLDHDGNNYNAFCSSANVVCASATGPTNGSTNGPWVNLDALAYYSNYGRSAINVAAPGGNGSAVWAACSRTSLQIPVCQTGTFIVGLAGTSMAAPHVSGTAALIVEDVGAGRPGQVRARLQQTADDLGQPGTDPAYGKGRINVPRAIGLQ
jgi:lantibiotic leader peptide-processing serine protease